MKNLNSLKRKFTITRDDLGYIKKYQKIYKSVLQEGKKRRKTDNDRNVTEASNKTKFMWQLINRENGKTKEDDNKSEKKIGNNIITNGV